MYGLRLKDGTKVAGLHYKPALNDIILIDETWKWYKVTEIVGRVAYARQTIDPEYGRK